MKFADNILKTFATSISIVLSCFLSFLLLGDLKLTSSFVMGTGIILTATYLYSRASEKQVLSIPVSSSSEFSVKDAPTNPDESALKASAQKGMFNAEHKDIV